MKGAKRSIGLLGVPFNSAATIDGVARAPVALREAGLLAALGKSADLRDYGDLTLPAPSPERDTETRVIDPNGLASMVIRVRDAVTEILDDGHLPIVIGGDCPVLLGCLAAGKKPGRIGLLFVDGHEDAYLPAESTTGEAADMELAFALGRASASWSPELDAQLPLIASEDVRILGARDAAILRDDGVESLEGFVEVVDGDRLVADPAGVTASARSSLPVPWWFHLDLDVLSTDALPAVDYPQPGGLGWAELSLVVGTALRGEPAGWDVTIYNPDLDADGIHARRIVAFLGETIEAIADR
jgi:arginase